MKGTLELPTPPKKVQSSTMKTIAIVGAGGFAREVEWLIRSLPYQFVGFLADQQGEYDSPVLGDFSWLELNHVDALAIAIGSPHARAALGNELKRRFLIS